MPATISPSRAASASTLLNPRIAPDDAIAAADETMYQVKQAGKGAVRFRVLGRPVPTLVATAASDVARG